MIAVLGLVAMIVLAVYFMIVLYDLYNVCVLLSEGVYECPGITFDQYMKILGIISGIFYSVLTACLIGSYIVLHRSLRNKFKGQQVGDLSKSINLMFFVLVTSFTLRTIFLFFEGHY